MIDIPKTKPVNCRIGSLEIISRRFQRQCTVNCRIGSLETDPESEPKTKIVNCRIGSLESFIFF